MSTVTTVTHHLKPPVGGNRKMMHEMYTTRLGVKVHPDQDFDQICRNLLPGIEPGIPS